MSDESKFDNVTNKLDSKTTERLVKEKMISVLGPEIYSNWQSVAK